MKKLILSLALILGLNSAQAQDLALNPNDSFEGPLAKAILLHLQTSKPKPYEGMGYDHRSSIGVLETIFEDSGESFSRIFDNLPSEFPGVKYANEPAIKVKPEDYFKKAIKGHSYDSIRYFAQEPYEMVDGGRVIKVERESINCFNSDQSYRVRFIQITRYNGEIVSILDDCPDLK